MTTLQDRPVTALLVVDVQEGVVEEAYRRDEVVATVRSLIDRARRSGTPVVWVQDHDDHGLERGSPAWEFVAELSRREDEPVIEKTYGDAFEDTDLEAALTDARVGHLVVCGAQTDMCIRSTIHGAFTRGYDVTLVADAHTTEDLSSYGAPTPDLVIAHTNLYWGEQSAPGRTARVASAPEVEFTEVAMSD